MRQVANYDLIVSSTQGPGAREVLLLAIERSDVPKHLGTPQSARWVEDLGGRSMEVSFLSQDGQNKIVQFPNAPRELADKLVSFDRVMVVWMDRDTLIGENDIALLN